MLERLLDTSSMLSASWALDGLSARQAAISDNIANVNTPDFKRREVPFEDALARAVDLSTSNVTGAAAGPTWPFKPVTVRDTDTAARADGNNVDIESEMARLAETTLRYETLTQYVGGWFNGLKAVINSK